MQTKQLIFGLGNPGSDYIQSRHNAGFMFMDFLQKKLSLSEFTFHKKTNSLISDSDKLMLVKPQTFMNLSGDAVLATINYFYKNLFQNNQQTFLNQVFIAHDDLDLNLGEFKLQKGVGPKQHNGLLSIYKILDSQDFWHIRIGVDDRQGDRSMPPDKYVLQKLDIEGKRQLDLVFESILTQLQQ